MKRIKSITAIALIAVLAVTATLYAGDKDKEKGIGFYSGSWNDALAQAKKDNKLVFLDISASWCGPCRMLKANTFPDEEVGKFYNANFINVAVDGEKGEGIGLARKYAITGYPTLLFIDGNGNLVAKTSGYHNANEFLKLGQTVKRKYQ